MSAVIGQAEHEERNGPDPWDPAAKGTQTGRDNDAALPHCTIENMQGSARPPHALSCGSGLVVFEEVGDVCCVGQAWAPRGRIC